MSKILNDYRDSLLNDMYKLIENMELIYEENSTYYFIPPQLVLIESVTNYSSLLNSNNYDKSNLWDNWVYKRDLVNKLYNNCNLSLQDYYDLCFLKIIDTKDRPKCLLCGSELPFGRCMTENYRFKFCNLSHKAQYAIDNYDDPEYIDYANSLLGIRADSESWEWSIKRDKNRFIYKAKERNQLTGYLYFYKYHNENYWKIGISLDPPESNRVLPSRINGYSPDDLMIYLGSVEDIAECEARIKFLNKDITEGGTEIYNHRPDLSPIKEFNLTKQS